MDPKLRELLIEWRDARDVVFGTFHVTKEMIERLARSELDLMHYARGLK